MIMMFKKDIFQLVIRCYFLCVISWKVIVVCSLLNLGLQLDLVLGQGYNKEEKKNEQESLIISINTKEEVARVDDGYLSFTTKTGMFMRGGIPYYSKKKGERFLALCQGLSLQTRNPSAYWRIGGKKSNELVFGNSKNSKEENKFNPRKFSFYKKNWDNLQTFAEKLNWTVNFAINGLLRTKQGLWDPTNAIELMEYTASKGYRVNFDLGKAPNGYGRFFNVTIKPEQLANDFSILKSVSAKITTNSKIIGPDIAKNNIKKYFRVFLENLKVGTLDAVTYYYCNGRKGQSSIKLCMDPTHLDGFINKSIEARLIIRNSTGTKSTPIWIGEAADTYGLGVFNISNTFAAGFLMLDKMSLAARLNFKVFIRRELIGNPCALMDDNLNHRPIYWLSVLHKLLVGRRVLDVKDSLLPNRTFRLYAHCVNSFGKHHYQKGSVVVIALNLNLKTDASFDLDGSSKGSFADRYLLQAENNDMTSTKVLLNGNLLDLTEDVKFPKLTPKIVKAPFVVPAKSYGFFVLKNANSQACLKNT